jgi:hypothetical protein
MKNSDTPLILVFYMDKALTQQPEIMKVITTQLNDTIAEKKANIMAFIVPTDGEEKIECVNPVQYEKGDMDKLNRVIETLKTQFDIGAGADEGKLD